MLAAVSTVAVSDAENGIPASFIIAGFTTMMYPIVRNVVAPPMQSSFS